MNIYTTVKEHHAFGSLKFFLPGPSIFATSYEHAILAIKQRGEFGIVQIIEVDELIKKDTTKVVDWDDLIIPNRLQLN